jgi:hypothetical protein
MTDSVLVTGAVRRAGISASQFLIVRSDSSIVARVPRAVVNGKRRSGRPVRASVRRAFWAAIFRDTILQENSQEKVERDFSYCFTLRRLLLCSLPWSLPWNLIRLPERKRTAMFSSQRRLSTGVSIETLPITITLFRGLMGTVPAWVLFA